MQKALIYTDGSCHTQLKLGTWAAILFISGEKVILKGVEKETTHNRMEILGVLEALTYLKTNHPECKSVTIVSDSQYVVRLRERKEKLLSKKFITKKGTFIQNVDLVKQLFAWDEFLQINYEKIKAHQQAEKGVDNFNIEVDAIVRTLLRQSIDAL